VVCRDPLRPKGEAVSFSDEEPHIDAADIDSVLDFIWRATNLPFTDNDRRAIQTLAIRAIRKRAGGVS
jgi:hypothetical protein